MESVRVHTNYPDGPGPRKICQQGKLDDLDVGLTSFDQTPLDIWTIHGGNMGHFSFGLTVIVPFCYNAPPHQRRICC